MLPKSYNHILERIQVASAVSTLLCVFMVRPMSSQPLFASHIGVGGTGLHYISLNIEVPVVTSDSTFFVQSFRMATGYGASFLSELSFLPIEARGILFHGSNHIDLTLGVSIQVRYASIAPEDGRQLVSSPLNPTCSVAYRYEPERGGFSFRLSLGGFYHVGERTWFFAPGISIGQAL